MGICSKAFVMVSFLFIFSCATPVAHQTTSGRPEVCISNTTPKEVSMELASALLNRSYSISQQTANMIKADKTIDSFMGKLAFGSRYDSQPTARVIFNIVNTPHCVRSVADMVVVTNPGSAFERLTKFNNAQDSLIIQQLMNNAKSNIEARSAYNPPIQTSTSSDTIIQDGKYYSVDDFFKDYEKK